MRMIVFFDLPTLTSKDRKEYRKFRKFLIQEGFLMVQQSVYSKITLNTTVANLMKKKIKKHKPPEGLVQMLIITEKQYAGMEYVVGEKNTDINDTTRRLVVM